jgi:VIT1/CCC1 family predicted Fe2+/Mn2+ transporter
MTETEPAATSGREAPYLKRYREFWAAERAAAWLYRELAKVADEQSAETLERLAQAEDVHAGHWEQLLKRSGIDGLTFTKAPWRERTLARLARRFGLESILPTLVRLEAADARKYVGVPEAPTSMSEEEVQHGRSLAMIGRGVPERIAVIESRHRVSTGGWLRAATFGINDGLLSNLSLVMGIAGGTSGNSSIVLLAGVAGLLAGAFSMAAGEWVSVRSQRELYEREIEIERQELIAFPEEERDELAMIYRAKGIEEGAAERLAERIMLRPAAALDTLTREELGLNPNDLSSPWVAALSSFFAFAVGAFIPVIPFTFSQGNGALVGAATAAAFVLAGVGLSISLLTGKRGIVSAFRMLAIGAVTATGTYFIGKAVGVSVS